MDKMPINDNPRNGGISWQFSLFPTLHLPNSDLRSDHRIANSYFPPLQTLGTNSFPGLVTSFMSHPNINPPNQVHYATPPECEQHISYLPLPPLYYLSISPVGTQLVVPQYIIHNPPNSVVRVDNHSHSSLDNVSQVQNNNHSPNTPNEVIDYNEAKNTSNSKSNEHRTYTKPLIIPTTKFVDETFNCNPKRRSRRKRRVDKLPDPSMIAIVKEVLILYELNQKSLALDIGCSETIISQWINGTSKATGWFDLETKIQLWLIQEHNKPERGPAYDFIDESMKLKSKFLRKRNQ
eukprot:TRINITY_DN1087_c0_g1_i2.p1 TRINITY_DN1087_c0_g1~~TRINITY_DN1087_c0_g1_i2.p1  ORF type:complete len:293 (+),score=-24.06 TRINITY_DN1087_c0_g1_i2:236-1114(+)